MQHATNCPVCGVDAARAQPWSQRVHDRLWCCAGCGSLFANPRFEPHEVKPLYEQTCAGQPLVNPPLEAQLAARPLHRTVAALLRRCEGGLFQPGRRVLDFGCGYGLLLDELRRLGLQGVGIEMCDRGAEYARTSLGLDVRQGDESALAALPEQAFDLVIAQEVLEHVLEPRRVLALLAGRLKTGGTMMISFPNLNCWRRYIEGGRWFNLVNPTHFTFFSMRAIRRLLEESGLGQVRRPVFFGGRPGFGRLASCLQYALRLANLGSDTRVIARKLR